MLELSNSQATKRYFNHKIIQLKNNFGFIANPNKKLQYNFFEALHQLDTSSIINTNNHQLYTTKTNLFQLQPKNLSMHNLCQNTTPYRDKKPPWSRIKILYSSSYTRPQY